jgi:hypothetical protein
MLRSLLKNSSSSSSRINMNLSHRRNNVTQLQVPNAALLLNAIATQYERIERVLLEVRDVFALSLIH